MARQDEATSRQGKGKALRGVLWGSGAQVLGGLGTDRPPPLTHAPSPPTCRRVRLGKDGKVDDTGGEVEGCLLAVVDHRDAVAVPVAGPRHAPLEDGERQPGGHRRAVGWAGAPNSPCNSHRLRWQLRLRSDQGGRPGREPCLKVGAHSRSPGGVGGPVSSWLQ